MKTMIKTTGIVSVLAMAVAATNAIADPMDQLFFTQDAGWADPLVSFDTAAGHQFQGFSGATDADAPANTFSDMAWSGINSSVQSSINLTGADSHGGDETAIQLDGAFGADGDGEWNAGDWWVISTLTQTNRALLVNDASLVPNPLWEASTLANLRVFSDEAESDLLVDDLDSQLDIAFWETLNVDGCANSPSPLATVCDDIYRVSAADFAPIQFSDDGYLYSINFTLIPGPSFDNNGVQVGVSLVCPNAFDVRCDDVDVTEGEIWVITPEFNPGTSSLSIAASWSVVSIPEPSVLAMFGAGILGMGLAGRRRKQIKAA